MLGRHFLDLHAAFGRGHHRDAPGLAVDEHADIKLALDVAAFLDIDALDLAPLGAGLLGDEDMAQHRCGGSGRVGRRLDDAHPAFAGGIVLEASGAAAPGMDLRLDDIGGTGQSRRDLFRLLRRIGDTAFGHGDAEFLQQALGLVLVNIHGRALPSPLTRSGRVHRPEAGERKDAKLSGPRALGIDPAPAASPPPSTSGRSARRTP